MTRAGRNLAVEGVTVELPAGCCAPDQSPLAAHAVAFVDDQVRLAACPMATTGRLGVLLPAPSYFLLYGPDGPGRRILPAAPDVRSHPRVADERELEVDVEQPIGVRHSA
jgi:hypothetical protein